MNAYLVIVMLTFMDGSVSKYNDGAWETSTSYEDCQLKIEKFTKEMRVMFKEHKPTPSTFITACVQKENKIE